MEPSADEFAELRRVIEILRGPGGCPWDREQKLPDVARYLGEEAAEAADAVTECEGRPDAPVRDELGDVLMNVLLAARIAEEDGAFSIEDVCRATREKLVRRHPHVFGDAKAETADEVLRNWQEIKAVERAEGRSPSERESRLDRVPRSLPPLARAHGISKAAADVGFDWPEAEGALAKVREELGEVSDILEARRSRGGTAGDLSRGTRSRLEDELGDLLFATVNLCRKLGVDPDAALRSTLKKFARRFELIERRLPDLEGATLEEMDAVWNELRRKENTDG